MLCYYGKGGFVHDDVYNMPRYLRSFYLKQIEKIAMQQQQQQKQQESQQQGRSEIFSPPVTPKQ
tara:strand:+ start:1281 stop:1472 length:192 start_codon:yes stop_codon:yes gene_type:complete